MNSKIILGHAPGTKGPVRCGREDFFLKKCVKKNFKAPRDQSDVADAGMRGLFSQKMFKKKISTFFLPAPGTKGPVGCGSCRYEAYLDHAARWP